MDKWATGIKEMDSVEEDYFNGDEDDDVPTEPLPAEDIAAEKPFELKRRRSADDDEDELLQIAQRSPHGNGTSPMKPSLSLEATEESNGIRASGSSSPTSSPPSDKPLREKRPRDSDDQEDEMDRLSRSSKRIVSPTDVKRKPSRGTLNGGRKIAISIGKK
jgi:hypothetical protein